MQRETTPTSIKNMTAKSIPAKPASHWPFICLLFSIVCGFIAGFLGQIISVSYPLSWPYAEAILKQAVSADDDILIIRDTAADSQAAELAKLIEENHAAVYSLYLNSAELFIPANRLGGAIALTNDGWLVISTADLPSGLAVVSHDRDIYSPEKIISDAYGGLTFIKISEHNLTASAFSAHESQQLGDRLYAYYRDPMLGANLAPVSLINLNHHPDQFESTDELNRYYLIDRLLPSEFISCPLYNNSGKVVGLSGADGKVIPADYLRARLDQLLSLPRLPELKLGINYYDLARAVNLDPQLTQNKINGALLVELTQEVIGLKPQDIVLAVDDLELNSSQDFNSLLMAKLSEPQIKLRILRAGVEQTVEIKLNN